MQKTSRSLDPRESLSLGNHVRRARERGDTESFLSRSGTAMSRGAAAAPHPANEPDLAHLVIEADEPDVVAAGLSDESSPKTIEILDRFVSCSISPGAVRRLLKLDGIRKVHTNKRAVLHLDEVFPAIGLSEGPLSHRLIEEDGRDVVIGVVDSGFDLTHPVFHGVGGLRVEGLLDQMDANREYTAAELEQRWQRGLPPSDLDGHGTHVASIAGGSRFLNFEGIAPGARLLFVRTDFHKRERAVSWIFKHAGDRPCVVNLSLGHHFGPHDGSSVEERVYEAITGPGRIIVASAGNERERRIHFGGRFHTGQRRRVMFDILRNENTAPRAILTIWNEAVDAFEGSLVAPSRMVLPFPPIGGAEDEYVSSHSRITLARAAYNAGPPLDGVPRATLVQTQIQIEMFTSVRDRDLEGWALDLGCTKAFIGRIDGWFHNDGFARFREGPLIEETRTVGMPATGRAVISVGSYASKEAWECDEGIKTDDAIVRGRISVFSSLGPTRDGRSKPEIAAPGQYVTGALARRSQLENWSERIRVGDRTLTLEGTSMAAPVLTGLIALLLQRKPSLDPIAIIGLLRDSAKRDAHTGLGVWSPAYGYGKADIRAALARV